MKLELLLVITLTLSGACASTTQDVAPDAPPDALGEPSAEAPTQRETARVMANELPRSASDFETFIGLRRGDPDSRIAELFGLPDASDPGDTSYRYVSYANEIMIGTDQDNDLVGTIDVSVADLAWLELRGVRDPRLALVGMPIAEIRKLLGEPTRIHAGNYTYEWTDEEDYGIGDVNFICYDFWDDECREVQVQWYYF